MKKSYFITGTDTDAGKTYITAGLLTAFKKAGYSTLGIKPISAASQDPYLLQEAATVKLPMEIINPISLKIPAAPHIEAKHTGLYLDAKMVIEKIQPVLSHAVDIILVEGVGGWFVPLNATQTMADVVKELDIDVILVVGMRLGCLNHALLTVQAILNCNVNLTGWVANCIDPKMGFLDENISTLTDRIKAPLLGIVPFGGSVEDHVDLRKLNQGVIN